MLYSSVSFLALVIHLIINYDVFRIRSEKSFLPAQKSYRYYLWSVALFYLVDLLWGVLYEQHLLALVRVDTALYFLSMTLSNLAWTRYVVDYLKEKDHYGKVLTILGWLLFGLSVLLVIVNFFYPLMFSFDRDQQYYSEFGRFLLLILQIMLYLLTGIHALFAALNASGTMQLRQRTIAISSLAMAALITFQAFYSMLPLYAIGCLLSVCVLHSFVLENEQAEYRDQLEERLQKNILKGNYYDLLTGLPGMTYFFELAQHLRDQQPAGGSRLAFLHLNLSGLKFYNQSHGFAAGDHLLHSFAQLLSSAFGTDCCSRLGQDHFAVVTAATGDALEKKLQTLFQDWADRNESDFPSIHVGVCVDPADSMDVNTICDLAKIACDSVRTSYLSVIQFYDTNMYRRARWRQYILTHLDQALRERWIHVFYQPIIRAETGLICDEEALARWNDPERGFLSPREFVPLLEEAKLIYRLDLYMVDRVLEKLQALLAAGQSPVPQSINLSRSDFESCDIVEEIRQRVEKAGVPPALLSLEVTESTVGQDPAFMKEQIERCRSLGFRVWLDDFGSGYSTLDMLQEIQVDVLKFDLRFMQQFAEGSANHIILTELARMASALNLETVCEGVERPDQRDFLREIGCTRLQGYFYSRPLPMDRLHALQESGDLPGYENG